MNISLIMQLIMSCLVFQCGDGEVELREDHRSEEGDADGVGKGRGGVKESAFLA